MRDHFVTTAISVLPADKGVDFSLFFTNSHDEQDFDNTVQWIKWLYLGS